MSEPTTPVTVRMPKGLTGKIARTSKRIRLSQQDVMRLAIERGLPVLEAALEIEPGRKTKHQASLT